uniref:Putative transmembrane protein n=1 Tax=Toxoplasma gondii COUG TaxID=1074873 RepID=A0A2G8Y9P9_TOXGO|nr:putative transmembrane protein [Toxoplasma gondii COUG]
MWGKLFRKRPPRDRGAKGNDMDNERFSAVVSGVATLTARKVYAPFRVKRRLITAAELLDTQPVDVRPFMDEGENLDATIAKDQPLVQAWFTELVFQLLTILAVCSLAFAVGIIIGSIMCRTTLFSGSALDNLDGRDGHGVSWVRLYLPDTSKGGWKDPDPSVKAVLRGAFDVSIPEHSLGSYVEALSAVMALSYVPADSIGRTPREECFTSLAGSRTPSHAYRPDASATGDSAWVLDEIDGHGISLSSHPLPARVQNRLDSLSTEEELRLAEQMQRYFDLNLITRAIHGLSLITSSGSAHDVPKEVEVFDPNTGSTREVSRVLLQHSKESSYPVGMMFSAAMKRANQQVPPTILLRNVVPFIVGLTHGLNSVRLSVTLNVPLVAKNEKLFEAMRADCAMGRVYFALDITLQAVRAMFFKHTQGSIPLLPFRVPCSPVSVTEESDWPPATPQSFVQDVAELASEYSSLNLIFGEN